MSMPVYCYSMPMGKLDKVVSMLRYVTILLIAQRVPNHCFHGPSRRHAHHVPPARRRVLAPSAGT